MKKILSFIMPVKSLAALFFAGLMCAYMVAGALYAAFEEPSFQYTIPFIFVLEGVGLSIVTALLCEFLLSDRWIKKMRYLPRLLIFAVAMIAALTACLLIFFQWHTNEAKLWLIVAGLVVAAIGVLSIIGEVYFRKTGKKYTEILKQYQSNKLS